MVKGDREWLDMYFPVVRASRLSRTDDIMQHKPQTKAQEQVMKSLRDGMKKGLMDFRRAAIDPSLKLPDNITFKNGIKSGRRISYSNNRKVIANLSMLALPGSYHVLADICEIVYQPGMYPACGLSPNWWKKKATQFWREKNSRLCNETQHFAFIGTRIAYIHKYWGYPVEEAWREVCDCSKRCAPTVISYNNVRMERTGSRPVGRFYDMGNVSKYITDDEGKEFFQVNTIYSNLCALGTAEVYSLASSGLDGNSKPRRAIGIIVMDV